MDEWERERQRQREIQRKTETDRQTEIDFEWGAGMNESGYINTWLASFLSLLCFSVMSLAHRIISLTCEVDLFPSVNPLWKPPYRHIYRSAPSVIETILKSGKSTMKVNIRNFPPGICQ